MFDIFLCDMLFVMSETEFASYANSNTPYVAFDNVDDVIKILKNDSIRLFKWFLDNNAQKSKFFI